MIFGHSETFLIRSGWLKAVVLFLSFFTFLLEPDVVHARKSHSYTKQSKPRSKKVGSTHHYYKNSRGVMVHSPVRTSSGKAPRGASARCRDGSYSFSQSRRGTCSHHGGVGSWL